MYGGVLKDVCDKFGIPMPQDKVVLPESGIEDLKKQFSEIDKNGDGQLDRQEI